MRSRIDEFVATAERKAHKVEQFIALLKDPDIADLVAELTRESPGAATAAPAQNGHSTVVVSTYTPGVTAEIRAVAPSLPRPFTIPQLLNILIERKFQFGRPALDSVRDAVYFLVRGKKPIFRIVEQGIGGKLSKYEYIGS